MTFVVESGGPLTLFQDGGRPAFAAIGVSPSGAFDRGALRQVNAVLGNRTDGPVLETFGGLSLLALTHHVVAVTGGIGTITIDRDPVAHGRAVAVRAGQRLSLGPVAVGLRAYLGVAGGFDPERVLGSASRDTLSDLGPGPVQAGDELRCGAAGRIGDATDIPFLAGSAELLLDVMLGPRDDWFSPEAVRRLIEEPWTASPRSDRVGVRLEGPPLARARSEELPSEPVVRGGVQVPADGLPIVFGPDHPVTGGYPVIAVVTDASTDLLAQVRPGQRVRFRALP